MNKRVILCSFLFIFIVCIKCEKKEGDRHPESKTVPSLPYFRRKVEELGDADFYETTEIGDAHNLVKFLIENMKEIFNDIIKPEENEKNSTLQKTPQGFFLSQKSISTPPRTSLSNITIRSMLDFFTTEGIMSSRSVPTPTHTKDLMLNDNLTLTTPTCVKDLMLNENFTLTTSTCVKDLLLNENFALTTSTCVKDLMLNENLTLTTLPDVNQSSGNNEMNTSNELTRLSKDLKHYTKDKKERNSPGRGNAKEGDGEQDPRRSCIMCNSVATEECNDPKNKLITSIMCERDDDLCYSLHTPFGIVDRGCFNVNHNLTTYVCACNLCNYISISEMPYMFTRKKDWVENVIELSHTKNCRKSVFKDMSCLKCEVNTTTRTGDMLDSANCLEGNIGNLPMEECDTDEVCGVKALRADGYIWRGCMKLPLYNYWWSICDSDLCNYDTLVTLYEFLV